MPEQKNTWIEIADGNLTLIFSLSRCNHCAFVANPEPRLEIDLPGDLWAVFQEEPAATIRSATTLMDLMAHETAETYWSHFVLIHYDQEITVNAYSGNGRRMNWTFASEHWDQALDFVRSYIVLLNGTITPFAGSLLRLPA